MTLCKLTLEPDKNDESFRDQLHLKATWSTNSDQVSVLYFNPLVVHTIPFFAIQNKCSNEK